MPNDSKNTDASFSQTSKDSFCLQVAEMPILIPPDLNRQQTTVGHALYPLRMRGVIRDNLGIMIRQQSIHYELSLYSFVEISAVLSVN